MSDEVPYYSPNAKPAPPKAPKPTKPLWEVRKGFDMYSCELVFHDGAGTEARILKNGEWFVSRRLEQGWQTLQWAEEERKFIESAGG